MKKIITVSFILLLLACTKEKPDNSGFEDAVAVANDVLESNIMPWIVQLANVRANDVVLDNTDFPPGELFPTDHLTRDASIGLIAEAFKSMGYTPDTTVLGEGTYTTYNVFAEWPGTTHPEEVILVGSHLDAFYAGADDNGSAVAAMLETARVVRNHSFARTIRFVAFDLEELGSIGSTRYVKAGYADDVKAAIVLDLIGYASSEPGSQKNIKGIKFPDIGDYMMVIGNKNSSEMAQQVVALGNSYGLSKLVGVIARGDGANFRNDNYHMPTDLPETLDADFLAGNTRALTATVAILAEVQP